MNSTDVLKHTFGYNDFRAGQAEVVDALISGESTLAIFSTGAGKSMCYQVPALMLPGLTLVVSPLLALMKDQVDFLKSRGVLAEKLDSTLNVDEYRGVIRKIRRGELKILFVSPERFNNEIFRNLIDDVRLSLFVIDEAHCISEWGHNFRPDYLKLANYAKRFEAERVLCLTATANKPVEDDIVKKFSILETNSFRRSAYRDNLNLDVISVASQDKMQKLSEILSAKKSQASIVYVTLQKTAEEVATHLRSAGVDADFFHAGIDKDEKERIQDKFMSSSDCIIVATIAFGMGIDKSNIRNVIHFNLPKSIENYYQEIGRAGRDGDKSNCIMLLSGDDIPILESFALGDFPESDLIRSLLNDVFSNDVSFKLKLLGLSKEHDIKPIVLKTILTQLELKGHITELTPVYENAKFKYIKDLEQITADFPTDKREYLVSLFSKAKHKKTWSHFNIEETTNLMNIDRKKFMDTLDYLASKEMIEFKVDGLVNRFKFIDKAKTLSQKEELINEITTNSEAHLVKQIDRIKELISFFTDDTCIHSSIAKYFEVPLDSDCGHCSYCINKEGAKVIMPKLKNVNLEAQNIKSELTSHPHILASESRLSKYLLGLSTPYISKNKLSSNKYFACLELRSWEEVQSFVKDNFKRIRDV
jgi:ATP-dependent DNA helicase RecQ